MASGAPRGQLMAMPLTLQPSVKLGIASQAVSAGAAGAPDVEGFDVAPDGRFLLWRRTAAGPGEGSRAILVQNWPEASGRK